MKNRKETQERLLARGMSTTVISDEEARLVEQRTHRRKLDLSQRWENPIEADVIVQPTSVVHLNRPNRTVLFIILGILVGFIAVIVVLFVFAPIYVAPAVLGLVVLFIAYRLWKICKLSTREFERGGPSATLLPVYKDQGLMRRAWHQSTFSENLIFYQPREGYCGMATVNSFLASLPVPAPVPPDVTNLNYCLPLSKLPRPYSLGGLFRIITTEAARITGGAIRTVESIPGNVDVRDLAAILADANKPNVRILANFLRLPLFFADQNSCKRMKKLFGGHWSPIGAYLPPVSDTDALLPTSSYGAVLLLDVNPSYGPYLVPVDRFWEAINTRDFGTGLFRGLLRITLRSAS